MEKRAVFQTVLNRLQEPRSHIQVLLGPRQVGKTTLSLQVAETIDKPCHYISADLATLQDLSWLVQQWETARQKIQPSKGALLIIDEVQKIPHWSEMIKALWDADSLHKRNLSVLILGSSPWLMKKGLTESLAGRFEIIPATHWSFADMKRIFHWSLEKYIYFGGYPGAAPLIDEEDSSRWSNYINDSLIETTISRDILLMTQINKPALLRRLFQLACCYSGQILSYNKMLGELHEAGNTTTLAHYTDLLSGVGLVEGLQKFASQKVRPRPLQNSLLKEKFDDFSANPILEKYDIPGRVDYFSRIELAPKRANFSQNGVLQRPRKASSPKFCVYNTALMSAQSNMSYAQAREDRAFWGRLVESSVGAHLLNATKGTQVEVFYWREGDKEVDFVLQCGTSLTAIEVKSSSTSFRQSGMDAFRAAYSPSRILLVGEQGLSLEEFFLTPLKDIC